MRTVLPILLIWCLLGCPKMQQNAYFHLTLCKWLSLYLRSHQKNLVSFRANMSSGHSALKSKNGHLGGDAEDDNPKIHWKFGRGHWISVTPHKFPMYFGDVILSIPAQMSSIFKIHRLQGAVWPPVFAYTKDFPKIQRKKGHRTNFAPISTKWLEST